MGVRTDKKGIISSVEICFKLHLKNFFPEIEVKDKKTVPTW